MDILLRYTWYTYASNKIWKYNEKRYINGRKNFQNKLKNAQNNFQQGKIIDKYIIKSNISKTRWDRIPYEPHRVLEINDKEYPIKLANYITKDKYTIPFTNIKIPLNDRVKASSVLNQDQELFVVVYKIEFNGLEKIVTSYAHTTKEKAIDEIKSDNHEFEFILRHITSDHDLNIFNENTTLMRISENSSPFVKYLQKMKETPKGAFYLLVPIPITISLIGSIYLTNLIITNPFSYIGIILFTLLFTIIYILNFAITVISSRAKAYNSIDITEKTLEDLNIYNPNENNTHSEPLKTYTSITCSIRRFDEGLYVKSIDDNIDCSWFFDRDDTGLLCKEGRKFINNYLGSGNEVGLTIKKIDEENENNFVSKCGKWLVILSKYTILCHINKLWYDIPYRKIKQNLLF